MATSSAAPWCGSNRCSARAVASATSAPSPLDSRSSASTSVKLGALTALESQSDRPELAPVLLAAVRPSNSTSVKLKAMNIAGRSPVPEVRQIAGVGLVEGSSTSVQLQALQAMAGGAPNDPEVADALQALFDGGDSSTSVELAALDVLARHIDPRLGILVGCRVDRTDGRSSGFARWR